MKLIACRLLVLSSAALLLTAAHARTRPHYGDSLRAETETVVMSGDPTPDALVPLVFETLVTVDDAGHLQPGLATSWTSANSGSRWDFTLRGGVTFHDGSRFDSSYVVACLSKLSNQPWKIRGSADGVVFESSTPLANLPATLSLPQYAITSTSTTDDVVGTGPFEIEKRSGPLFTLKANDDYWGGRPYLDSVDLWSGRSPRDQATDFSFDRADVVEVAAEQLRRAQQDRLRLDISRPADSVFVIFDSNRPELRDVRLRQAISLAIDRAAIRNVIFQHQGEIASGLLPNWLSGYEFLFDSAQDLVRARQLRMEVGLVSPISIGYDPGDPTARLIAERIALNAHDAGFSMQAMAVNTGSTDLRLRRMSLPSLHPAAALNGLADRLNIAHPLQSTTPETTYELERDIVQAFSVIPVVHLPQITSLKDRVRDWTTSPHGAWHLDRIWLASRNARAEVPR